MMRARVSTPDAAIYTARFGDKFRPVLILVRGGQTIGLASKVTVAGITSTTRGLATELPVGPTNGLNHACVVNLADIQTIRQIDLGSRQIGRLLPSQELALHTAIVAAFDLEPD